MNIPKHHESHIRKQYSGIRALFNINFYPKKSGVNSNCTLVMQFRCSFKCLKNKVNRRVKVHM